MNYLKRCAIPVGIIIATVTIALLAGVTGCGKEPVYTYYGEIENYDVEIINDGSAWKTVWYKHTYTLKDGRVAMNYTNYLVEGFIEGGYLYGYQDKNGYWTFKVRSKAMEEK